MRLFGRRKATSTPEEPTGRPATGPDDPRLAEVREYAADAVYAGFSTLDEITERALDHFDDDPLTDAETTAILEQAWEARARAIAAADVANPLPDASSRLSAAFRALEDDGILARMDFTCCQSCGHDEIRDERSGAEDERGYTFFHQQDTERIPDGLLYLAFGAFRAAPELPADLVARAKSEDDTPERAEARREVRDRSEQIVADTVAGRLREAGLSLDWDGTTSARIAVDVSDWRRPLPVE